MSPGFSCNSKSLYLIPDMPPRTKPLLMGSREKSSPFRKMAGFSCPALENVNFPVCMSSMPHRQDTNMSMGLFAHSSSFVLVSASAGE